MKMPKLEPISIDTKGIKWYKKIFRWLFKSQKWRLIEDYTLEFRGFTLLIHSGFITDFASVPRIFWFILSPTGILLIPGLIHDYYYTYHYLCAVNKNGARFRIYVGRGKLFGDKIFKDIGIQVNDMVIVDTLATWALYLFGWPAWWKHRRQDA